MLSANQSKCKFFFSKRGCALGTDCRFSHSANLPPRFQNQDTGQHGPVSESRVETGEVSTSPARFNQPAPKPKICFHFKKFGSCRFGENCRFLHCQKANKTDNESPAELAASSVSDQGRFEKRREKQRGEKTDETVAKTADDDNDNPQANKVCPYYKRGNCWRGSRCKFLHSRGQNASSRGRKKQQQDEDEGQRAAQAGEGDNGEGVEAAVKDVKEKLHVSKPASAPPASRRPPGPTPALKRSTASQEEVAKMRDTELSLFKKRYPGLAVEEDAETGAASSRIVFKPSDPDWPFDVKTFELEVTFPRNYPSEMFSVKLPLDQDLPDTVRHYLEVSVQEWLAERGYAMEKQDELQLQYRPFLRWLDRSIEELVTDGLRQMRKELMARASGIEIVPAHRLQAMYPAAASSRQEQKEQEEAKERKNSEESEKTEEEEGEENDEENSADGSQEGSEGSEEDENRTGPGISAETEHRGTQVSLRSLQLVEGVGTMRCERLSLVLQCGRCRGRADLVAPGGRVLSAECCKCHQQQLLTFRPSLAHSFSSTIGYLDVADCHVFDVILQDSAFLLGCLACNKETLITSLPPGSVRDAWCQHCHQRMKLAAEGARISVIDPASLTIGNENVHQVPMPKSKKTGRDPAIQLGKPLPANGTCRHYKKSFRWLRFPCCGMAYPCDLCHDENETDHDMKFANRMICGFCCKEQPYSSDRPCINCLKSVTKGASTHWEGGKGCRDKIKMSRNDTQKYASMQKTVSRHAQKLKEMASKKKTKLRHT